MPSRPRFQCRCTRAAIAVGALALLLTPAVAAAGSPPLSVLQTADGIDQQAGGGYAPPDVQVAAGPGYVVEMANLALRIWRTSATAAPAVVSTRSLDDFYGTNGSGQLTDPRILYDAISGRWFASISSVDGGAVELAVSHSADPTGAWSVYSFDAGGNCADQPRLGTDDDVVVLAADLFTRCESRGSRPVGSELWIVNKAQLLAGAGSPAYTTYGPTFTYSSPTPAHSLSHTSTEYVVSVDSAFSSVVHLLSIDGVPPGAVTVREVSHPALSSTLSNPPDAVEPDGSGGSRADIDTNDQRVLDAVWENGKLWFSANESCTPPGDTTAHACGRVDELSTVTAALDWEQDIAYAGTDVFFPTVRPDGSGNVVIAYGQSSATESPVLAAVARRPDATMTTPVVVARSAFPGGLQNGRRWGDYFGSTRDPSDPSRIWVAGETGPAVAGTGDWTTTIAALAVSGSVTSASPTNASVVPPPPGVRARPAGGRAGKPLRLSFVSLDDGTAIRRQVTVLSGDRRLFRKTTKPAAVKVEHVYSLVWHPARGLAPRTYRFCVRFVSADGVQSPPGCAKIALRR